MKIVDIKPILLSAHVSEEQLSVKNRRDEGLILVHTDEGITGLGEGAFSWRKDRLPRFLEKEIRPILIGEDPLNIGRVFRKMLRATAHTQEIQRVKESTLSAIDIALWDILGKVTKTPIWRLLGGKHHEKIKAYATMGLPSSEKIEAVLKRGFKGIKISVGRPQYDVETDIKRVIEAREIIGDKIELMIDGHDQYSPEQAFKAAPEFTKCNLTWWEMPMNSGEDFDLIRKLKREYDVKIAGGERFFTAKAYEKDFTERVLDVVNPDVGIVGGFTEARKVAAMAELTGMLLSPHIFGATISFVASSHLIASAPNTRVIEFDSKEHPIREELVNPPILVVDGFYEVPNGPGLGIELNEDAVSKYREEQKATQQKRKG